MIRTFSTGSTRDTANGKLEYTNYIHPLNDYSFAQYMKWKQIINWVYRRWDNRQFWIPAESLFDSLCRHIEIVKLLQKWLYVYEVRDWEVVDLVVSEIEQPEIWEQKDIITELNACRFNSEALKLQHLTGNFISE